MMCVGEDLTEDGRFLELWYKNESCMFQPDDHHKPVLQASILTMSNAVKG